ncbi:uncharacterized protein K452DRAFT_305783 [Aplosporella prunicola CBS 121167]|uniref:Major facilitator superfamily (MFS) profile domain-containing protein n=1 Tax=Aplosporella prunicola CBS 121167 TaxID=1176127 RepID=A0A6A6BTA2_9PEZI|nr:uncharacterized protein K452DRAFT_305783 [Aplosporella prunicola CBS 121167]KAF2145841.1 hypothetical protein K452DRAFT_305783 [Aplosporella prunicola CBS 121167]
MQSIRQFRNLRQQVHEQLHTLSEKDISVAIPKQESDNSGAASAPNDTDSELEKSSAVANRIDGVECRKRSEDEGGTGLVFVVGWGQDNPQNPYNWSTARRLVATLLVAAIALSVTATSSVEAAVTPQSSATFHVSETAGSLTTGMYLIGFAVGSLFAGSFSEMFGRNLVYLVAMIIYMLFIMGTALAPNFAGAIILRFFSGFFGSTPLTVAGGTIADIWTPLEAAWTFPLMALLAFGGPLLGPVISAFIGGNISFRWAEWLMLILAGVVLSLIMAFQPETYSPLLLRWRAQHLRRATGDDRYRAEMEIKSTPLAARLLTALWRPFAFVITEPIVLLFAVYLTLIYIVLFTFFNGFAYIFTKPYGISQGLTNIIWLAVLLGVFLAGPLIPILYRQTARELEAAKAEGRLWRPEIRLWYAMLGGSVSIPISLFWVGWTCYSSVSIWAPICGTVLFGYGLMTIFTSAYMYIIDVYLIYAASALSFNAFARYTVAGGMTVVGIPMFERLGPHWTLTLLGCISVLLAPIPFVLYRYGPMIRQRSKNVVNRQL